MLKDQIGQLKKLLAEMQNPSPLEFQRITAEFNKFKDANNPNKEGSSIDEETLLVFLADKFRNFEFQRQLRDHSRNADIKTSTGAVVAGLYYELVATILKYDKTGWEKAGFDITPEEMFVLKENRNMVFHVPEDVELFQVRCEQMKTFHDDGRLKRVTGKNSGSLLEYVNLKREKYKLVDFILETAFKPSREKNFLWDNYKPGD